MRKLSFTGSTEVGRVLMRQCADTIKKLSLELGGNAPFIVFDDADPDAAVEDALASKFCNTGQTCVCANRLYVQSGVYDAFAEKLAAKVKAFKVGSGTEAGVNIGPLIDANGLAKVEGHVAVCIAVYPPVLFYTGSARTSGAVPASGLMGEGATDAAAIAASATTYARKDFPPTLLQHGTGDKVVPVTASLRMHEALAKVRARVDLHLYAEQPHGWARTPQWVEHTMAEAWVFLDRYVANPAAWVPTAGKKYAYGVVNIL